MGGVFDYFITLPQVDYILFLQKEWEEGPGPGANSIP